MAMAAQAQTAPPGTPAATPNEGAVAPVEADVPSNEIIVTARKRAETLLNVPAAVTAFAAADLVKANATDLSQISRLVPQLQITNAGSGSGGGAIIRGIGSSPSDSGLEAEVLIDIDGIPTSRGWLSRNSYFDIANVQVLKGPQALFFGKNSPAGVVSITTNGPTATWQGYARAGYELIADQRFVEAAIGGPISDTLGIRVAGRYDAMEGWMINNARPILDNGTQPLYPTAGATTNKRGPSPETKAGRITLNWTPSTAFKAELKSVYSDLNDDGGPTAESQVLHCSGPTPRILGIPDPYMDCKPDRNTALSAVSPGLVGNWTRQEEGHPFLKNQTSITSLKLDYDTGPVQLTSVTGYTWFRVNGQGNYEASSFNTIPGIYGESFREFSEEARALTTFDGPVNALVGAYYSTQKRLNWNVPRIPVSASPTLWIVPDPTTGLNEMYDSENSQRSSTISPFAQLTWNITHNLELAGGARYTKEIKRAKLGNAFVNQGIPEGGTIPPSAVFGLRPAGDYLTGRFADDNWSPEGTITWHPTPRQTVFAAYRSGYKSGGFSVTGVVTAANTIASLSYGSESSKGFEAGYKVEAANGRFDFDAVLYRYTYGDLQRTVLDPVTISFIVRNAAKARIQGGEITASYRPFEGMTLHADLAYNDAKYLSYANAQCFSGQTAAQGCVGRVQDLSGARLANAPEFVGTVSSDYQFPVAESWSLGINGAFDYNSGYIGNDLRQPFTNQGAFIRLHAGIRLFQPRGNWSFEILGRNLTDEYIVQGGSYQITGVVGDTVGTIERPRQIVFQAGYKF